MISVATYNGHEIFVDEFNDLTFKTVVNDVPLEASTYKAMVVLIEKQRKLDFKRFDAWRISLDTPQKVTVTSNPSLGTYWVYNGTRRMQVSDDRICLCTPENNAIIVKISGKREEIDQLQDECDDLRRTLTTVIGTHPRD